MAARARPHSDRCSSSTAELLVAWRRAPLPCRSRRDSGVFRPGRSSAGAGADADSGEGRGRCDVRAGRRHRRPTRRVPALGRRREARPCAALSSGLPQSPHERRRRPWRGHRGRHRARGRDNHGARPRPALRSVEGLLGGRGHRRHRSRGCVARVGGMGRVDRRWRSRSRDRRARDPGRLEDRHGAVAQVGAVRAAEGDRRQRGGVPPRPRPGRVGLPAHEGRAAPRVGADEGRARAVSRRDRAAAAVRTQGGHAVGGHVLDWREADRLGQRLGRVPHAAARAAT